MVPAGFTLTSGSVWFGRGDVGDLAADDGASVEIDSQRGVGSLEAAEIQPYAAITPAEGDALTSLVVDFAGTASSTRAQMTVRVFNFADNAWETIDGPRKAPRSDHVFSWAAGTAPKDYVSSAGELRISVRAERDRFGFRLETDMVGFRLGF